MAHNLPLVKRHRWRKLLLRVRRLTIANRTHLRAYRRAAFRLASRGILP
jgi:hypothetical protein